MAANAPDPKRLAEVCKLWGFTDENLTPKTRRMRAPDGTVVEIKRDTKEALGDDMLACALAAGMPVDRFMAGPTRKVQATEPRRRVIEFLAAQPNMRVSDKSGRVTGPMAEALGVRPTTLTQLLAGMIRDGQVRAERNGKRTFALDLILDGPRVRDMLPLEAVPALNADLPTQEAEPEPEPQEFDLANWHPDEIAAALLERVLAMAHEGSPVTHAKVVAGLEARLAEQLEFSETEQRKRRQVEDELGQTRAQLQRARDEIAELRRARSTLPKDVVESILVNGKPRVGKNRRPHAASNSRG